MVADAARDDAGGTAVVRARRILRRDKCTRGDWATVEKRPGCVEANNRYAFGTAHPIERDTVAMWADACP